MVNLKTKVKKQPLDGQGVGRNNEITAKQRPNDWPQQVSLAMETLLGEFAASFFRAGKSSTTIRKYLKDLRQFFREKSILQIDDISRVSIQDWMDVLRVRGCGTGFIANHLWAAKAFLAFAKNDKGLQCYEWDIRIPKVKPPESVEYLELDEIRKLYELLDISNIHDARLRTFMEVMLSTGMRPTEVLSLKRSDFSDNPQELEIIGKGNKKRNVYFTSQALDWIYYYLSKREDDHSALFVICNGKEKARAVSLRNVECIFQKLIEKSGINRHIKPHTLRHTFATQYVAKGCDAGHIMLLLGHSSVKTTRKYYIAISKKHAKEAFFRFNPFEGLNSREAITGRSTQLPALAN